MKKTALRTDESHFRDLPDYPFAAHYLAIDHPDYNPLRLHYVKEHVAGQTHQYTTDVSGEPKTVLLLHGCPTWSFLYRKVIHELLDTRLSSHIGNIIAPDFIGCGKSDKLRDRTDYSYDFYVDTLKQFIRQLDLQNIILVCQDWGGPIGLRVASEMPESFAGILASNTLLPNCEASPRGIDNWPGDIINQWVHYTQNASDMVISKVVQGVTSTRLPDAVLAAYDAPFPDARYKQGMLQWPSLIPRHAQMPGVNENRKAWDFLETSHIPFVTAFSDQDPSTLPWENVFQHRARGAQGQSHRKIANAGHMVQEDDAKALATAIAHLSFHC